MSLRIATFNLENLNDDVTAPPPLAARIHIMHPQLERVEADILCFQEIHGQGPASSRTLSALDQLLSGTPYAGFHRQTTLTTSGQLYDQRNLVTLSRFPIVSAQIIRGSSGP